MDYERVIVPWDQLPGMTSKTFSYLYKGIVSRIVDGDSYHIDIDYGMKLYKESYECRGYDYDTWETYRRPKDLSDEEWEEHKEKGKFATAIVEDIMPPGSDVIVLTAKDHEGKYGRLLVTVYVPMAEGMYVDLTATLRKNGALKS